MDVISHIVIILSSSIGAIGHAYLTSRQELKSPRTIFDIVTAGMFGALYPVIKLRAVFDLVGLGFLAPEGIPQWPIVSQVAYMLGVGYVFSSLLPSLIEKVNGLLSKAGMEIKLPSSGVVIVPSASPIGKAVESTIAAAPETAEVGPSSESKAKAVGEETKVVAILTEQFTPKDTDAK